MSYEKKRLFNKKNKNIHLKRKKNNEKVKLKYNARNLNSF